MEVKMEVKITRGIDAYMMALTLFVYLLYLENSPKKIRELIGLKSCFYITRKSHRNVVLVVIFFGLFSKIDRKHFLCVSMEYRSPHFHSLKIHSQLGFIEYVCRRCGVAISITAHP